MKYAWIKNHSDDFSINALCAFMKVSRSSYYEWLNSPKTDREKENDLLIEMIKTLFQKGRSDVSTLNSKESLHYCFFHVGNAETEAIGRILLELLMIP